MLGFFYIKNSLHFFILTKCKDLSRGTEVWLLQSRQEPWMMLVQFLLCHKHLRQSQTGHQIQFLMGWGGSKCQQFHSISFPWNTMSTTGTEGMCVSKWEVPELCGDTDRADEHPKWMDVHLAFSIRKDASNSRDIYNEKIQFKAKTPSHLKKSQYLKSGIHSGGKKCHFCNTTRHTVLGTWTLCWNVLFTCDCEWELCTFVRKHLVQARMNTWGHGYS